MNAVTRKAVMAMPNDLTKCPYCGTAITSKDSYYAHWECGSVEHGRDIVRSTQCKLNVANAEIEKLRGIKKHNADELDKCFEQQVYKDNAKLSAEVETLREEQEKIAEQLSDVWIHLDSWARGEAPDIEFIQKACKSILTHQQVPGWKTKTER